MKATFNKTIIVLFFLALTGCNFNDTNKTIWIGDYMNESRQIHLDSSIIYNRDSILTCFDTVPNEFGWLFFNNVIKPIPFDSSDFKRTWSWSVDSVKTTMICKTNSWFDPYGKLSDSSLFLIIHFNTTDSLPIAATIYMDFLSDSVGTFILGYDSLKSVKLDNDSYHVPDLNAKMTLKND